MHLGSGIFFLWSVPSRAIKQFSPEVMSQLSENIKVTAQVVYSLMLVIKSQELYDVTSRSRTPSWGKEWNLYQRGLFYRKSTIGTTKAAIEANNGTVLRKRIEKFPLLISSHFSQPA